MAAKVKKCLIITGAPEENISYYNKYTNDRFIISADSGYEKCLRLNIKPDLIIGDFDSSKKPDTDIETIILPVRKDDTDTFYAVKEAIKRGFGDIIILGGIGSRVDHTYTNILALNYCLENNACAVMLNQNNRIRILSEGAVIKKDEYSSFSLFALFGDCTHLTTTGTQYNLTDYTLTPDCPLAQSNAFKDDKIEIKFKSGKILLIESND